MSDERVIHKTIAQAIHAVMCEVEYVQRTPSPGLNYNSAKEPDIIQKVRPSMLKHGLVGPIPIGCATPLVENHEVGGKPRRFCVLVRKFRVFHADSDQFVDVETAGEGFDSLDKATPKACTGAKKYAIRELFLLETGDDPDAVVAERDAENAPEFRRAYTAIVMAESEDSLAKTIGAIERRSSMFNDDQMAKLRSAADNKRRSFPGAK